MALTFDAVGELGEVCDPVAQGGGVVRALAEPAVVQHDQVDAHLGGL